MTQIKPVGKITKHVIEKKKQQQHEEEEAKTHTKNKLATGKCADASAICECE